ncbi:Mpv17/PMP22 family protein [Rhodoferax sp.]|uniref:Mpv17/PMP22 family protein n=1 Tax=Rhodoferax sp. TaxID=50421 RepID=UPI00374DB208
MEIVVPRTPLQQVRAAVKANLLPGLVLWCGLAALVSSYLLSPAVQAGLAAWGNAKQAGGYPFAFASYAAFAVLVPEALGQLLLKQPWRKTIWADMAYATLVFGCIGITVDMFYVLQVSLFGEGNDGATIAKKMLVDQFVYSPMTNFAVIALFAWREDGYRARSWKHVVSAEFLSSRYLPLMVALWCVWIPGVVAIYFMPTALQFPVASLILSFWILIFKFIRKG